MKAFTDPITIGLTFFGFSAKRWIGRGYQYFVPEHIQIDTIPTEVEMWMEILDKKDGKTDKRQT